jgi:hypothetical protein
MKQTAARCKWLFVPHLGAGEVNGVKVIYLPSNPGQLLRPYSVRLSNVINIPKSARRATTADRNFQDTQGYVFYRISPRGQGPATVGSLACELLPRLDYHRIPLPVRSGVRRQSLAAVSKLKINKAVNLISRFEKPFMERRYPYLATPAGAWRSYSTIRTTTGG